MGRPHTVHLESVVMRSTPPKTSGWIWLAANTADYLDPHLPASMVLSYSNSAVCFCQMIQILDSEESVDLGD